MATLQCSRCGGTRYDTNHRCEKGCGVMTASAQLIAKHEAESLRAILDEVEAERHELFRDLEAERHHRRAVERDRDALAAHVEYLTSHFDEAERASLNPSPATSLARRDARVKAEALKDIASRPIWCTVYAAKASVLEIAQMHRQQAEEAKNEQ